MRVFILGAGFSRCCEYPSGKELFKTIYGVIDSGGWKYFEKYKKICLEALSDLRVDISKREEVYFDELVLKIKEFSEVGKDSKGIYILLKIVLTETARSYFYGLLKEKSQKIKPVLNFVKGLKKNVKLPDSDIIVSFNWDLLVEYAIQKIGHAYGYDLSEGDVPILKPHGSINWRRVANYEGIRIFDNFEDYNSEHRVEDAQLMIMPYDKERKQIRKLQKVQEQVEVVLSQTNEFIIIGYSMPDYDAYVLDIFKKNILPRIKKSLEPSQIIIVDPYQSVINRYKALFSNDIKVVPCNFENTIYASDEWANTQN